MEVPEAVQVEVPVEYPEEVLAEVLVEVPEAAPVEVPEKMPVEARTDHLAMFHRIPAHYRHRNRICYASIEQFISIHTAADTSVSVKDINVKAKTAVKNNTVKVKNIAAVLKKEITKAEKEQGGRIKDLSVEITFDTGKAKNWKNLHLEMDKQAVNLLVKKNVKEWKVNGGNVNLTFDSKALKELKKEMNTAVVIKMKQADKKNLSARAGKIIGKRPVYDFSVTGIKKKQSSVLKKGRIRVAVSYNASKKEKDKKIFAYKIDKYGAAVKIPGSYYDSDTKTVNFVSRGFFTVAVGCEK